MSWKIRVALCCAAACYGMSACGGKSDPNAGAPPPTKIEKVEDRNVFEAEKPEQFAFPFSRETVSLSIAVPALFHRKITKRCSKQAPPPCLVRVR